MEGALCNLIVEGRLQGTLVPLVSRAMPFSFWLVYTLLAM